MLVNLWDPIKPLFMRDKCFKTTDKWKLMHPESRNAYKMHHLALQLAVFSKAMWFTDKLILDK